MKTYTDFQDIAQLNRNSFLFLDTSAIILIVSYQSLFEDTLLAFKKIGVAFTIIPSIKFELLRTDSLENQLKRSDFMDRYCQIYPIERHLQDFNNLISVIHKISRNSSYPDFLLYCCLYKFLNKSYLLTANHKDFKTSILDRVSLITIDNETEEMKSLGIYSFSSNKYEKAAKKIIKEMS